MAANEDKQESRAEAEAFARQAPNEAAQAHPQLAGAYAAMAAIEKKVENDGLSPQQRAVVMERVRANMAQSIERGEVPETKVRETVETRREARPDKENTR